MMNARDVFVRRPPCVSLWVAPVKRSVFANSRAVGGPQIGIKMKVKIQAFAETYMIFKKSQQAGACAFYSEVEAETAPAALKIVLGTGTSDDGLVWWVIPASEFTNLNRKRSRVCFRRLRRNLSATNRNLTRLTQMRRLAAERVEKGLRMEPEIRTALLGRLLAAADDELILGHRNSEWCGHAPILEEDIAFANIALDEIGHAVLWYGLVAELHGENRDTYPGSPCLPPASFRISKCPAGRAPQRGLGVHNLEAVFVRYRRKFLSGCDAQQRLSSRCASRCQGP